MLNLPKTFFTKIKKVYILTLFIHNLNFYMIKTIVKLIIKNLYQILCKIFINFIYNLK